MRRWNGQGLKIGDLEVSAPLVQGGMGVGVSGRRLGVAVAAQGGIGVISAVGMGFLKIPLTDQAVIAAAEENGENRNLSVLRQEIRRARKELAEKGTAKGALGVNIMVAISEFADTARTAIEEDIDFIFAGAGLPMNLPEFLTEGKKTKLVPIISSAKAAKLISKRWLSKYQYVPDAFVLEGPMAGGHLGFSKEQIEDPAYALEAVLPEVLREVAKIEEETGRSIPVIAGGGIFSGEDIYKMLKLGASGVQMATRFVATEECDADLAFKEAYVHCKKEDIGIIESPVGLPGRAIINGFLTEAKQGLKHPKSCPRHCIITCKQEESPYCISSALLSAVKGRLENGFAFIGANGYRVNQIVTVKDLMDELEQDFLTQCSGEGK